MSDIATAFKKTTTGPYDLGLKVKVVAVDTPVKYTGKDGSPKEVLSSAVSDGNDVIKVTCYDAKKFRYFQVDKTVMLRNTIKKMDDGKVIVVTTPSRVAFWAPLQVDVPEAHKVQGRNILTPPPAEVVAISAALASPKRRKVSVTGRLVQEEECKTVKANKQDVQIKNIIIEDNSGRAKITLWRDNASAEIRPGDFVEVTDVQTNVYNDMTSLSTTMKSTVKKIEAPETTEIITVCGLSVHEDVAELFLDMDSNTISELSVPAETLQQALLTEEDWDFDIENACQKGPFKLSITRKGSDIMSLIKVADDE